MTVLWLVIGSIVLAESAQEAPLFQEVTKAAGIEFVHDPGAEGRFALPEIMGSGAAFLDFDADGDLDLYLVQSGPLPGSKRKDRPPDRLYRQDALGKFAEVTGSSGLANTGYGSSVAVGDIDNDGLPDLYVGNHGPDFLYHNQGNGVFADITTRAGIAEKEWTASAVFCDYDLDGFLDLYVTHYVKGDPSKSCVRPDGAPDYCSPQSYEYGPHALYRNDGDRKFTDVTGQSGVASVRAPGLGVLCGDFTNDGLPDFYVANDGEANLLWESQGNGKFLDQAILMGAAYDSFGRAEAGMGVTAGDIEGDGDLDLFVTNLENQTNTLYVNDGKGGFEDRSSAAGVAAPSLKYTGFGTAFFDFDHDGDLDIIGVNGRVAWGEPLPGANISAYWNPFAEPNFLLENDGQGRFRDITSKTGSFGAEVEVTRGLSLGDYDSDGDLDVLVTNTAGPARLYRNDAPKKGRWLLVRALDGKRDAHGAVVTVSAGGKKYVRLADPAYSYLSSNDPRAHFGIPEASKAEAILVRWPGGAEERFPGGPLDRVVVLRKGEGQKVAGK